MFEIESMISCVSGKKQYIYIDPLKLTIINSNFFHNFYVPFWFVHIFIMLNQTLRQDNFPVSLKD